MNLFIIINLHYIISKLIILHECFKIYKPIFYQLNFIKKSKLNHIDHSIYLYYSKYFVLCDEKYLNQMTNIIFKIIKLIHN